MRQHLFRHLVLGMALVMTTSAQAQTPSYADLLQQTLQQMPQSALQMNYQQLSQAHRRISQNWLAGGVNLRLKHENDALTGSQDFQSWEAGADLPLQSGRQSDSQAQIAEAYQALEQAFQAELNLKASKQVRQLVWQTKKTEMRRRFSEKNLQQTQAIVDLVVQRVAAGESPPFDLILANKSLAKAQQQWVQVQSDHHLALRQYQRWTGYTLLPVPLAETAPTAAQMPDSTQHPHSRLLQAQVQLSQAKVAWQAASGQANPSLYLGAKQESDQASDNQMLIAEISIPFGHTATAEADLADQKKAQTEAQIALRQFEKTYPQLHEEALQQLKTAELSEQLAQSQTELSEKAMQLAQSAYQQGETSIQNLLLMKQQYFEDKLNFRLARLNRMEKVAQLNQVLGVPVQ